MMSSPPGSAISPPAPTSLQLPKKRPSLGQSDRAQGAKRRKPSVASNASHPLRQTSFPPPGSSAVVSPSRDASFSPSASSFGRGSRKRKAGRSTTGMSTARSGDDAASRLGRETRGKAEESGQAREEDSAEEDDDDDEEGQEGLEAAMEGSGIMGQAAEKQEREHLMMLTEAFTPEQSQRYEMWRRVRLKKEVVRRLANQTLSQSVPASIVTTVGGYTKLFIGEIIERAREVQEEWLVVEKANTASKYPWYQDQAEDSIKQAANNLQSPKTESPSIPVSPPLDSNDETKATASSRNPYDIDSRDRGPLTPDHLREALRRYKKDREGGSAGFQGLSLTGKENVASRTAGRRLFK